MRFLNVKNSRPLKLRSVLRKKPNIKRLCQREGIELLFLHGSLAQDHHGPLSDVDVAMTWPKATHKKLAKVEREIAQLFNREDVDLAILDKASSLLGMQVITKGIPLYVKSGRHLKEFRYRTYRQYLDSRYLREKFADIVSRAVLSA